MLVETLIAAGAWVEYKTTRQTPLICALDSNAWDVADILLASDAHVDFETDGGLTALSLQCISGNTDAVRYLLKHGADADRRGHNFSCPAILAASNNHAESLRLLIEHGCELSWENELNTTAMVRHHGGGCSSPAFELLNNHYAGCGMPSKRIAGLGSHDKHRHQLRRHVGVRSDTPDGSYTGTSTSAVWWVQAPHHRVWLCLAVLAARCDGAAAETWRQPQH